MVGLVSLASHTGFVFSILKMVGVFLPAQMASYRSELRVGNEW